MRKNKVTNYFMPASTESNVKETRNKHITVIENQPQKQAEVPIIDVHKPFHPQTTDNCFPMTKFGEGQRSCQIQWFLHFPWLYYDERQERPNHIPCSIWFAMFYCLSCFNIFIKLFLSLLL